jgi:hypothetical protein
MRVFAAIAFASLLLISQPVHAQSTNDPTIEACRNTGLIALKEQLPVRDLVFDVESLAVSKANTSVEDIRVRTVIMGEAYLETKEKETGGSHRFVCLIGNKGKVLLTFFTAQ